MDKDIRDILDARDFINNLTYSSVKNIIEDKDKITYDNGIIEDFMNMCRDINFWEFDESYFKNMKLSWITSLTSVVLNFVSNEVGIDNE